MGFVFLIFAIVFNSAANVLFKFASGLPEWDLHKIGLFGFSLFLGLVNTLLYIKALETIELSIAYSVLSAASIVVIVLISLVLFKEGMSAQKIAGLATICVGLLMMWKA